MRLAALATMLTMGCATPYVATPVEPVKSARAEFSDPFDLFLSIDHPSMEHRIEIGKKNVYTRDGQIVRVMYESETHAPNHFFALAVAQQEQPLDPNGKAIYSCHGTIRNIKHLGTLLKGSCNLVGHFSEPSKELIRRYLKNEEPDYGLPSFSSERNTRREMISRLVIEGLKGLLIDKIQLPEPELYKPSPKPFPRLKSGTVLAQF
jgi:hypothetical protein